MPSSTKRSFDSARVPNREGVGGEPLGETRATPSGILGRVPDDTEGLGGERKLGIPAVRLPVRGEGGNSADERPSAGLRVLGFA